MIDVIQEILGRADQPEASTYLAHEVARWPQGALEQLVGMGLLRELGPSLTVRCFNCAEQCDVEPEWRQYPTRDKPLLVFNCGHVEYGGRLEFEPESARRWEIPFHRLCELVAEALAARGPVIEETVGRLAALGTARLGGIAREIFLARGLHWPDAVGVLADARRFQLAPQPIVLYPALPPEPALNTRSATLVCLRDFLVAGDTPLALDLAAIADHLSAALAVLPAGPMPAATSALPAIERTILTALSASAHQSLLVVEIVAAAGYGKTATLEALSRLERAGLVARPAGTRRKGVAITPQGQAHVAAETAVAQVAVRAGIP